MGGSIIRFTSIGHEAHILDLTNGEPTPLGETLKREKKSVIGRQLADIMVL